MHLLEACLNSVLSPRHPCLPSDAVGLRKNLARFCLQDLRCEADFFSLSELVALIDAKLAHTPLKINASGTTLMASRESIMKASHRLQRMLLPDGDMVQLDKQGLPFVDASAAAVHGILQFLRLGWVPFTSESFEGQHGNARVGPPSVLAVSALLFSLLALARGTRGSVPCNLGGNLLAKANLQTSPRVKFDWCLFPNLEGILALPLALQEILQLAKSWEMDNLVSYVTGQIPVCVDKSQYYDRDEEEWCAKLGVPRNVCFQR